MTASAGDRLMIMMRLQPDPNDDLGNEDEPFPVGHGVVRLDRCRRGRAARLRPAMPCSILSRDPKTLNLVVRAEGRSSTPRTGFRRLSTLLAPLAGVLSNPSEFGLFHAPQTQWRRGRYFVPDII
ncbi:hypothetical protein ABD78_00010 [Paenibacillus polymyxa]|nr:hypothetical protein [Paenibacillus polymyxa]